MTNDLIYSLGEVGPMTAGQTYRTVCEQIAMTVAGLGGEVRPGSDLAVRMLAANEGIHAGTRAYLARTANAPQTTA